MPERVRYLCPECGSDDLRFDAFAEWSEEHQCMELAQTFDCCTCQACGAETNNPDVAPTPETLWRGTLTVNVLCTAEITVEVEASSLAQARERAEAQARKFSHEERWKIDDGGSFDWGSMQIETIEPVEEDDDA